MNVKLRVLAGTHAGKEIALSGPEFVIGRAEDCHLRAGSELISRRHCAILIEDSKLTLRDFGSRNGTQLNGQRVEGDHPLAPGDRLQVGPLEFEVVVQSRVGGSKRPAVKDMAEAVKRTAEPAKAKSVEDDISAWLGEPDAKLTGRWVPASDTQSIKLANTDTVSSADIEAAAQDADKEDSKKKEPGKLPKFEPPKAKDSREAAANILKQMAKRK